MKKEIWISPDFDRAADKESAWRKTLVHSLDAQERASYKALEARQQEALRDLVQKYHEQEPVRIQKETSKIMLEKPDLALRLLPSKKMQYSRARSIARHNVFAQHQRDQQAMERKHQEQRDNLLHSIERDRAADKKKEGEQKYIANQRALSASLQARAAQKSAEKSRDQNRDKGRT